MATPLSMVLVGRDAKLRADTRAQLTGTGKVQIVAESSDYARAFDLIEQLNPHGAVVVLNGAEEVSLDLVRRIASERPATAVVCTGLNCPNELIIRAFRSGAREFLIQPAGVAELRDTIERLEQLSTAVQAERQALGTIIALYSSKGGSGTTTIGVNLAAALARQTGRQTAIVDLNLQHGNVPVFFGIEPSYSIADVAHNEQRLDVQLFRSFLTKITENLYCLAAPLKPEEADDVFPNHLEITMGMLRSQFAFVIVDTQHVLDPNTVTVLDLSDVILVVTQLDLASIYNTKRVLETFRMMGYTDEKMQVIVNRHHKGSEMPLEKVAEVFGQRIKMTLSDDGRSAREALNLGKPVIFSQQKSPLIKEFLQLSRLITQAEQREEKHVEKQKKGTLTLFGGGRR